MSKFQLSRTIYCGGNRIRGTLNLHGHNHVRTVTAMAAAVKSDVQDLSSAKPFESIPKLPMVPFFGSSWVYFPIIGRYRLQYLHVADHHKHKTYGDIVREKFGDLNFVSSYVPETMEIMSQQEGKYPSRGEIFDSLKKYRESRKNWYKTNGVLVVNGKEWGDLRIKTQKYLMKPKTVQTYLDPMQDVAKDFVKLVYEKRDSKKEVDGLLEDLYKWALESIANIVLDTRLGSLKRNLAPDSDGAKLIQSVQTQFYCINKLEVFTGSFQFWKYLPSSTYKKFAKASDIFTEIAFKYINLSLDNIRKQTDEDADLTMLQSMLMSKDLDMPEAVVMVADMFFAGIDTTAHTVGFLFYHLAKNPEKQKILAEEIKQLLPNETDRITPDVLSKLRYLKACLKEAIRLSPITRGIFRSFDHDVVISGYRVPAGTLILCNLPEIYKDKRYFKNPDQFIPERWMDKDDKLNAFSYAPFGIGTRSCIGRRLSELEILCVATEIIRNFSVEYHHEDIGMITRFVNMPDKPLRFSFLDQ